ncbi:hypothetical protein QFZ70_000289 [Arthrobacter sp. V1I9]|uniref:hypothetical protein n=1 Tax=Arthrobacter sp. V1I9 TaxID=3042275 RepID=UPI00278CAAD5|nr:hypothetical protein [Arthrobacter sp. V1I9]MDQ0867816.1 hypothetical protein [Arthrobacter sp. V1I9]
MNSRQSSSEQFMRYLKSLGGSEADVSGSTYVLTPDDTVESVVSRLRIEQQADGGDTKDPSILHASAQVMISRRDEGDPGRHAGASQAGAYQLDIRHSPGSTTRESIPSKDIEDAKVWARERIEAQGAQFGAIFFPAGGGDAPGTGALATSFDRSVGWYR